MIRKFEPIPNDSHKSFYGKCSVYVDDDGSKALRSYNTIVMSQDASGAVHRHWGGWSATTARHIRAVFPIGTKEYRQMNVEPLPEKWRDIYYTL